MADDLWWAGDISGPARLRVKKAARARASDFDRPYRGILLERPDLAVARDPAAVKRARRRRKDAIIAAGGQVIEAPEPSLSDAGYGLVQGGLDTFYRQALGMDESTAQQAAAASVQGVEGLVGLSEMERAGRNILAGEGGPDDYLTAALTLAAGPALKLAAKIPGVKYLGRKTAEGAKSLAARGSAAAAPASKYLSAPSRRFSAVDDAVDAVAEETAPLAAKPVAKSEPLHVKTEDEGDWDLPDLDIDVPITFDAGRLTTPATAVAPRGKIEGYHGTPHRFEPEVKVRDASGEELYVPRPADLSLLPPGLEVVKDYPLGRFRSDRMGTGAGAQMYGAGAYAAEAPKVARSYRTDTLAIGARPTIGGIDANQMYLDLMDRADRAPIAEGQPLYDRAALLEELLRRGDTMDVEEALARDPAAYSPDAAEWFREHVADKWDAPGALYKLDLNVDPEQMLAWNTPLVEQPRVFEALKPLMQRYDIPERDLHGKYPLTGGDIYHQLSFRNDGRPLAMADLLTGSGLSGVRYVDTGSGRHGTSTQNYVIMNPELIDIVKRYSAGGAVRKDA